MLRAERLVDLEAQLVFDHQSGPLTFRVNRAVYSLSPEGGFSCSIECESNPQISYAYEPCFCFMRCPVGGSAVHVGQVLRIEHRQGERDSFDLPSTHLYTGVHFDPWDASVTVLAIDGDRIETLVSFLTDDPDYYDERARDTRCECRVWLSKVAVGEVRDLM